MPVHLQGDQASSPRKLRSVAANVQSAARQRASFARAAHATSAPYVTRELDAAAAEVAEASLMAAAEVVEAERRVESEEHWAVAEQRKARYGAAEEEAEAQRYVAAEFHAAATQVVRAEASARQAQEAQRVQERRAGLLEERLAEKVKVVEEVFQLQSNLEARLSLMDHGFSLKDVHIEALARQHADVAADRAAWRDRVEALEEDNRVLRQALLERMDESQHITAENRRLKAELQENLDATLRLAAADRYEEENRVLRRALLERADENQWLRSQLPSERSIAEA